MSCLEGGSHNNYNPFSMVVLVTLVEMFKTVMVGKLRYHERFEFIIHIGRL